jgi:hypothetical protein
MFTSYSAWTIQYSHVIVVMGVFWLFVLLQLYHIGSRDSSYVQVLTKSKIDHHISDTAGGCHKKNSLSAFIFSNSEPGFRRLLLLCMNSNNWELLFYLLYIGFHCVLADLFRNKFYKNSIERKAKVCPHRAACY